MVSLSCASQQKGGTTSGCVFLPFSDTLPSNGSWIPSQEEYAYVTSPSLHHGNFSLQFWESFIASFIRTPQVSVSRQAWPQMPGGEWRDGSTSDDHPTTWSRRKWWKKENAGLVQWISLSALRHIETYWNNICHPFLVGYHQEKWCIQYEPREKIPGMFHHLADSSIRCSSRKPGNFAGPPESPTLTHTSARENHLGGPPATSRRIFHLNSFSLCYRGRECALSGGNILLRFNMWSLPLFKNTEQWLGLCMVQGGS